MSENIEDALRACRPGLEIRSLEFLGEGDFCRAYVLNGHEVVRIPRHDEAARALAREACLMPTLAARLPATVPVPTFVVCPHADGIAVSLHEQVRGVELTREHWIDLHPLTRTRLARGLGGFLHALHALDPAASLSCGLETVDHTGEATSVLARVRAAPGSLLPGSLRDSLDSALARFVADGPAWSYRPVILHADVSPEHVLVDPERGTITGVIDWGDVRIGDPARDFIFLYEDWGSEFLALALEGYDLERTDRILPRIHMRYLIDQLAWTLQAGESARGADVQHGIAALDIAMLDFESSSASAG